MKKIILAIAFITTLTAFSQGTTTKEYNYLSKGYKDDLELGKDIIQGYKIEPVSVASTRMAEEGKNIFRITSLYKMVRIENGKVAGFLLEQYRRDTGVKSYLCIPNAASDSAILAMAQKSYYDLCNTYKCNDAGQSFSYGWNSLMIISNILSN